MSSVTNTTSLSANTKKEAMQEKKITFQGLLANELGEPHSLSAFEEFLRDIEHSEENLEFLNAIKVLKSMPSPWTSNEPKKFALHIVQTFLLPGAPKEVNCPNSLRKNVVNQVQEDSNCSADPALFDPIEAKIIELMRTSSFPHFVRYIEANSIGQTDSRPISQGT